MKNKRFETLSCGALGGRNPRTGKRVGSRHKWNGALWCAWCGRSKDAVKFEIMEGTR
jgi:hypothetical protein